MSSHFSVLFSHARSGRHLRTFTSGLPPTFSSGRSFSPSSDCSSSLQCLASLKVWRWWTPLRWSTFCGTGAGVIRFIPKIDRLQELDQIKCFLFDDRLYLQSSQSQPRTKQIAGHMKKEFKYQSQYRRNRTVSSKAAGSTHATFPSSCSRCIPAISAAMVI